MLSEFLTLLKIILCAMLMNPMNLLNHLIPSSEPKEWDKLMAHIPKKNLYCSLLACWLAFSRGPPSLKSCIVSFRLVCRPLSQNFVLFPHEKLAGLRQAFSFLKILYCSLLACLQAFSQCSTSPKFYIVPF